MADNVTADPGSGGATFATDDDGTAHHPYVKLEWGADNTQTKVASGASALPIQDGGNSITVDGAVAVTNAGTFAVQVDGAALTSLQLIDDAVQVLGTDTYTEATSKGITIGAVRRDADTTLVNTTNEFGPLQMDANGRLKVEAFSGETLPVSLTSTTVTGTVAVTQSGTWDEVGINDSGNSITVDAPVGTPVFVRLSDGAAAITTLPVSLASVPSHAVTNAGTFAVQVDGAALTALQLIDNANIADDAAFTVASTGVVMGGFLADETSTDSVDEGDGGAARMTLDRRQIVVPQPHASGGLSIFRSLDIDESEEEIKASAGTVYGVWVTNTATSTRWVKFYNATAANVTVGTTTPVITIGIPGNSSDDISGNFGPGGMGIQFDTAISVAATTGVADNDTGAPAANDVIINVFYK